MKYIKLIRFSLLLFMNRDQLFRTVSSEKKCHTDYIELRYHPHEYAQFTNGAGR